MDGIKIFLAVLCSLIAGADYPATTATIPINGPPPISNMGEKPCTEGERPQSNPVATPATEFSFEIVFHVAGKDTETTWHRIAKKVDTANEKYTPMGVSFRYTKTDATLPDDFAVLETIRERHKVKKYIEKELINVFVLDEILDPNPSKATKRAAKWQGRKPSGRLAGAHIPCKKFVPDTYIIMTADSRALTLAHELGHMLGLPHHRDPQNIMSYGSKREHFNTKQTKVIRLQAKRLQKRLKAKNQTAMKARASK